MSAPLFGKYRGHVVDNADPENMGRLRVSVTQVPKLQETWALPCVPYAGPHVGFYFMPPVGADVWVEFEGGDLNYPVWVGCFWSKNTLPDGAVPARKIIRTDTATLIFDDTEQKGGVTLNTGGNAVKVPASMVMDSTGITTTVNPAKLTMSSEDGIKLEFPPDTISMAKGGIISETTQSVKVTAGTTLALSGTTSSELTSNGSVKMSGGTTATVSANLDLSLTAGGEAKLSADGQASVSGGLRASLGSDAMVSVGSPACAVMVSALAMNLLAEGAVNVIAPAMSITGAVAVNGDLLIDGQQPLVV